MATLTGSITISEVDLAALTNVASARRVSVGDLANEALREYTRGVTGEFEQILTRIIPTAYAKATDAERVALIAQLRALAAREP